MAQQAGVLTVKLLYAVDLKDGDWFGKQDPYCKVFAGGQSFRSKTHKNGGKSPVWNETFKYNIINDNTITIELYDEDTFKDDLIGRAVVDLSAVRTSRTQHVTVPVTRPKSGKSGGSVVLDLEFQPQETSKGAAFPEPTKAPVPYVAAPAAAAAAYAAAPAPYPQAAPAAGYPAPSGPPGYPSAPSYGYPQPSGPSAPPGYPGAPQYGAPPSGYPPASAASYSGPPAGYPRLGRTAGLRLGTLPQGTHLQVTPLQATHQRATHRRADMGHHHQATPQAVTTPSPSVPPSAPLSVMAWGRCGHGHGRAGWPGCGPVCGGYDGRGPL